MSEDEKEEDVECVEMCCPEEHGHARTCEEGAEIAGRVRKKILLKLGDNLDDRGNVVMTRLNDDDLKNIDALVEVEAFKSRSEAAAFFIKEGIQARKDLFQRVMPTVEKIRELKGQAKKALSKEETE
jgi:Arc/MetJ-type ribon-helix-helix transcriptional regulator